MYGRIDIYPILAFRVSQNLGLRVVAEGVETKTQLEFLNHKMCDEVQGYYYYKLIPAEEVEAVLQINGILRTEGTVC